MNQKLEQIAKLRFFSEYNLCLYDSKDEVNSLRQPEKDVKKWLDLGYVRILEDYNSHGRNKKQNRIYIATKKLYKVLGMKYRPVVVKTQQLEHELTLRDAAMFIMRKYPKDYFEFNYKLNLDDGYKIIDLMWRHNNKRFLIEVENKQNPSTDTKNKIVELNSLKLPKDTRLLFIVGMSCYDSFSRLQTVRSFENKERICEAYVFVTDNLEDYTTLKPYQKNMLNHCRTLLRRYDGYKRLNSNYELLLKNISDLKPIKVSNGTPYHHKYLTPAYNVFRLDEAVWNIPGVKGKVKAIK